MEKYALLEEKWRVQKELSEKSGFNLVKYAELIDNILKEIFKKHKKKIKKLKNK